MQFLFSSTEFSAFIFGWNLYGAFFLLWCGDSIAVVLLLTPSSESSLFFFWADVSFVFGVSIAILGLHQKFEPHGSNHVGPPPFEF